MRNPDPQFEVRLYRRPAALNIDYLPHYAAGGVTDCWIEVQWVSQCPEIWWDWVYHPFHRIPSTGVDKGPCLGGGNEENEWFVNYRTAYVSGTKTVRWKGENEWALSAGGSFLYRLIAEAMFNVTGNVGYTAGITVETVTAISDYGPIV